MAKFINANAPRWVRRKDEHAELEGRRDAPPNRNAGNLARQEIGRSPLAQMRAVDRIAA